MAQCKLLSTTTDWGFQKTEQNAQKRNRTTDIRVLSMLMKGKTLIVGEGECLIVGSIISADAFLQKRHDSQH